MRDEVFVVVGKWVPGSDGWWDFVIDKKNMARSVVFGGEIRFWDLVHAINVGFRFPEKKQVVSSICYWFPEELDEDTTTPTPPICIRDELTLENYKHLRREFGDLNMFVSVEGVTNNSDVAGNMQVEDRKGVVSVGSTLAADTKGVTVVDDEIKAAHTSTAPLEVNESDRSEFESDGFEYWAESEEEYTNKDGPSSVEPVVLPTVDKGKNVMEAANCELESEDLKYSTGSEEDYDFDAMREKINNDYPNDNYVGESSTGDGSEFVDEDEILCGQNEESDSVQEVSRRGIFYVPDVVYESDAEVSGTVTEELGKILADIKGCDKMMFDDVPPVFDSGKTEKGCGLEDCDDDKNAICVGRVFPTKKALQSALIVYGIKKLFHYVTKKSDKTRVIAKCCDDNCKWRVYAHVVPNSENFEIKTMYPKHTCGLSSRAQFDKNATKGFVAENLKKKYTNGKAGPMAVDIPSLVATDLRVTISYMKGWHAREIAIQQARGTEEGSFKLLGSYLHLLKLANPGTVYNIKTVAKQGGGEQFKYLFFAMGQSIAGLAYMRKIIIIDGTQVKSKFKGCMMTTSAQDANFQVFPIGFGVVDGENDASWTWFFQNLIDIIPDSEDLLFISDRHSSIYSSLHKVYPAARHGACLVHLVRNVLTNFKNDALCQYVTKAGSAYTVAGFRYWFSKIEEQSPKCAEYLTNIGLPHWTRVYSEGMRFNVMSSNVAESLNGATTKAMYYPIVSMVEWIRTMLMRWFYLRRKRAARTKTILTPEVELVLEKHLAKSGGSMVKPASEWVYQVDDEYGRTFTVDFEKRECSCKVFNTLMLPCSHALSAAEWIDLPREQLANDCYTVETWAKSYELVILPPRNEKDEDMPVDNMGSDIEAPESRRPPGRIRKKRIKSFMEKLGRGKRGQDRTSVRGVKAWVIINRVAQTRYDGIVKRKILFAIHELLWACVLGTICRYIEGIFFWQCVMQICAKVLVHRNTIYHPWDGD